MNSRSRNFLADATGNQKTAITHPQPVISQVSEPEKIKHTLIGSRKAVVATIQVLHKLGYANVLDWTPLVATSQKGEVMSILIRSITVQQ